MGKLIVVLPVVSYFQGQEAREGWGGEGDWVQGSSGLSLGK